MTITELQNSFKTEASLIPDYEKLTKTELANLYCDYDEACQVDPDNRTYQALRSAYYAALMLRYWYKIFDWAQKSTSLHMDYSEFVEWLEWTFWDAFYYRMWRWEYKAVVKDGVFIDWKYDENGEKIPNPYYWRRDENAPDKVINRCAASARGYFYQYHNKDKRRGDVTSASLDEMEEIAGDGATKYISEVCDLDSTIDSKIYTLVSEFLKRGEIIEAMIIDGIAFQDSYKTVKDSERNIGKKLVFDRRRLVRYLSNITHANACKFCKTYSVEMTGEEIMEKLSEKSNPKLYKAIEKTLMEVKQTPELLECLL